jgi:hypothetical protein
MMNNGLGYVLSFVLGAGIGTAVTWKIFSSKIAEYEDTIAEIREFYSNRNGDKKKKETTEEKKEATPASAPPTSGSSIDMKDYAARLAKENYTHYTDTPDSEEGEPDEDSEVFVIPPEEFGVLDGYDTTYLTYYTDGVVTDSNNDIVDDVEDLIGQGALNRFGEYADDAVYVRNTRMMIEYEVLADSRSYAEVLLSNPHTATS